MNMKSLLGVVSAVLLLLQLCCVNLNLSVGVPPLNTSQNSRPSPSEDMPLLEEETNDSNSVGVDSELPKENEDCHAMSNMSNCRETRVDKLVSVFPFHFSELH